MPALLLESHETEVPMAPEEKVGIAIVFQQRHALFPARRLMALCCALSASSVALYTMLLHDVVGGRTCRVEYGSGMAAEGCLNTLPSLAVFDRLSKLADSAVAAALLVHASVETVGGRPPCRSVPACR